MWAGETERRFLKLLFAEDGASLGCPGYSPASACCLGFNVLSWLLVFSRDNKVDVFSFNTSEVICFQHLPDFHCLPMGTLYFFLVVPRTLHVLSSVLLSCVCLPSPSPWWMLLMRTSKLIQLAKMVHSLHPQNYGSRGFLNPGVHVLSSFSRIMNDYINLMLTCPSVQRKGSLSALLLSTSLSSPSSRSHSGDLWLLVFEDYWAVVDPPLRSACIVHTF